MIVYRGLVHKIQNTEAVQTKMIELLRLAIENVMKLSTQHNLFALFTENLNDFYELIDEWETNSSPIDYRKLYKIFGDDSDIILIGPDVTNSVLI